MRRILEAAELSAEQIRAQAAGDVERLEQAANDLRSRLDDVQRELSGVLDSVRRSTERLSEGLDRLHEDEAPREEAAPDEAAPAAAPLDGDEAGARLTALNMALGGTAREETARYLAEHYSLADREALLDDVYDRAGG